jgi:CheY-like chemotaxis protein
MLAGRTVLVVDDDTRNIFALSSALERRNMRVPTATTGCEAISILERSPEVAIVLMDIMMPRWTATRRSRWIRGNPALRPADRRAHRQGDEGRPREVPEAGASDYLAKPVNTEQLLSALRLGCTLTCPKSAPMDKVNIPLTTISRRSSSYEVILAELGENPSRRPAARGARHPG